MDVIKRMLASRKAKPVLWMLGLLPLAWMVWQTMQGAYVHPEESLVRGAGDWALRFLCLTLAVTPARVTFKLPQVLRFRRVLGLLMFSYAVVHLVLYMGLAMGFSLGEIATDIADRPFILAGMLTFLLLLPLALTSNNAAIRALGASNWQALHRLIYVAAGTAVLHFLWMRAGKNDTAEVWVYTAILGLLLGWRLWYWNRNQPAAGACGH